MLQYPLHVGADAELVWLLSEGGALQRFPAETPANTRNEMVDRTAPLGHARFATSRARRGTPFEIDD